MTSTDWIIRFLANTSLPLTAYGAISHWPDLLVGALVLISGLLNFEDGILTERRDR